MIIVTGATGRLGHEIARLLAQRSQERTVGVSVRDPGQAADLAAMGVRVRRGDFDDPESLLHAFENATQVLIVSSNAAASGGDPLAQHRNAIDAARRAGAGRVIYTSHMGCGATSAFPPMRDHAATEDMLRASGMAWTALRNGFYASSGLDLMGEGLKTGVIPAPEDGKVSWTAHADLSEAATMILEQAGRFDGPTPPLTGSRALDLQDLADIASELLGRPVSRVTVTDDAFRQKMAERRMPDRAIDSVLSIYRASRAGEFGTVDPTLEMLLGRPPLTVRDLMAQRIDDTENRPSV